jgi:dihydrofolate synthase/folylpolyglutamate synthase
MLWFAEQNCDYVVLETGLGGRLDATNICNQPEAVIITSLGYDHMERLGTTIAEIATEKAGIFKKGTPVYAYDPAASYLSDTDRDIVRTVLSKKAAELSCPLTWIGPDGRPDQGANYIAVRMQSRDLSGQYFSAEGEYYRTRLLGSYQPLHAMLAATAARPYLEAESIAAGIRSTTWPGRLEIISAAEPFILLDGAHNPQGSMALAETLDQIFPRQRVIFLIGVLEDKDYREILSEILVNRKYLPAHIIATEPPNPRSLRADLLAAEINQLIGTDIEYEREDSYNMRAVVIAAAGEATRQAVELARSSGLPLVAFGSLYLAGAIRADLRRYSRKH